MPGSFITAAGKARLEAELHRLMNDVRPQVLAGLSARAHGLGDHGAAQARLADLDARIAQIQSRLAVLQPKALPQTTPGQVCFGCRVALRDEEGREVDYLLLGAEEAEAARGELSWASPLARALAGRRAGEEVEVRTPRGLRSFEIRSIALA